jgi:hypothetical protein
MFTDLIVAKVTKKLIANQSAASNRSDSNENQLSKEGKGFTGITSPLVCEYPCQLSGKP